MIRGVVFDLGGVVLESPLEEIAKFELRHGLAPHAINSSVAASGSTGAWARLERGELTAESFHEAFSAELAGRGHHVDTVALMRAVESAIVVRPAMLDEVRRLRRSGRVVAACTNNWIPFEGPLVGEFDVFVESVVEGTRKPEPEIYLLVLERLGLAPEEVVMLDDLGPNLKPAQAMGMTTIKVETPEQAIHDLREVLSTEY